MFSRELAGETWQTLYHTRNAAGHVATSEVPAGTVHYTYNAEGQRILKESTDGSLTGYLFDHQKLLNETDDVGDITQTYISDLTDEFGDLVGEAGQYVHQYDAQAQTNALLDDTGQVAAACKYAAFATHMQCAVGRDARFTEV